MLKLAPVIPDIYKPVWKYFFVVAGISPILFRIQINDYFTSISIATLDVEHITIQESNAKSRKEIANNNFFWRDIKSFRFFSSGTKNFVLVIYLKRGKTKYFRLSKDGYSSMKDAFVDERSFIRNFLYYIYLYNRNSPEHKIYLSIGPVNSKIANIIFGSTIFLLALIYFICLRLQPEKTNFVLIMAGWVVLFTFISRSIERKRYFDTKEMINKCNYSDF